MTELFEKSIRVLELPQLLERLSQKAVSEAAKERALRLTPSTDADDVRRLQDETDAARALIGLRGSPSFSGVKDVREALARAERGGMLNPRELLTIAGLLTNSRRVREYYEADQGEGTVLDRMFDSLHANRFFEDKTPTSILSEDEIADAAFRSGVSHFSESNDGELNPTEIVAMLINRKETLVEGIRYAQHMIDGSCSILVLIEGRVYAARDRFGRTPVMIGEKTGAYAVTMETTALPNLDYHLKHELGPGEIVEITEGGVIQKHAPGDTTKICTFFWVYYGYPSSSYEGINTESARYRNGESMAADDRDDTIPEIDSVCGIPDSGIAHAIGYSNAAGKPYRRSFVKYTPTWPRSFMPQNQSVRDLIARMKLIPVQTEIQNKRMLFCDDSIVRGTQLKDTVIRLYERGAKAVHMRSACPPLLFGCKFLNFSRSRCELDLAARRAIAKLEERELTDEIIEGYLEFGSPKYYAMVEEIRKELNLNTLKFQKLEKLIEAIGVDPSKVCTYCWNGRDVEMSTEKFE